MKMRAIVISVLALGLLWPGSAQARHRDGTTAGFDVPGIGSAGSIGGAGSLGADASGFGSTDLGGTDVPDADRFGIEDSGTDGAGFGHAGFGAGVDRPRIPGRIAGRFGDRFGDRFGVDATGQVDAPDFGDFPGSDLTQDAAGQDLAAQDPEQAATGEQPAVQDDFTPAGTDDLAAVDARPQADTTDGSASLPATGSPVAGLALIGIAFLSAGRMLLEFVPREAEHALGG